MDAIKLLGSLLNNNSLGSNVLGDLLGGGGAGSQSKAAGDGGGLGALAGLLGGGSGGGGGLGALDSMLGGGGSSEGGGLGALASMLGSGGQGGGGAAAGLLGALMGMAGGGEDTGERQESAAADAAPQPQSQPKEVVDEATLLVRAMCNAAKADGRLDENEKKKILGQLGDVTQEEIDFVQHELSSPLDVAGFAADVPGDNALLVYSFSVMAIKLDEQSEARYLADLAQGLGLNAESCNTIHDHLKAPRIFA